MILAEFAESLQVAFDAVADSGGGDIFIKGEFALDDTCYYQIKHTGLTGSLNESRVYVTLSAYAFHDTAGVGGFLLDCIEFIGSGSPLGLIEAEVSSDSNAVRNCLIRDFTASSAAMFLSDSSNCWELCNNKFLNVEKVRLDAGFSRIIGNDIVGEGTGNVLEITGHHTVCRDNYIYVPGSSSGGAAIYVYHDRYPMDAYHCLIEGNRLENADSANDAVGILSQYATPNLYHMVVRNNKIGLPGSGTGADKYFKYGIVLSRSSHCLVVNNDIFAFGCGVRMNYWSHFCNVGNNRIRGCDCSGSVGIHYHGSYVNSIWSSGNQVYEMGTGLDIDNGSNHGFAELMCYSCAVNYVDGGTGTAVGDVHDPN